MRTSTQIREEIEERFGFFPPFFVPALDTPEVLENLWQQTLSAYVLNPLPVLFKEQLFAYLSRYCSVPYCVVCHSCALRPLGMSAREVLELIASPVPITMHDLEADWQTLKTLLGEESADAGVVLNPTVIPSLWRCSVFMFLRPAQAIECRMKLRQLLEPAMYAHLVAFLGYIKLCHQWVESYPELSYEADSRAQLHLAALLADEPSLAEFFQNYNQKIAQECQSRETELATQVWELRQTELALRSSEEQFRQIAENINQVFWVCSADGSHLFYISPVYEKLWGRTQESMYSQPTSFLEAVHPDDLERVAAAIEQNPMQVDEEYRIIRPDGTIRWVRDRTFPVKDETGHVYRRVGFAEDITERKHAEVALRESELQLRLALNAAMLGTWDWNLETNLVTWSERTEEIFGYAPGTFPGTYEGYIDRVHPSDRERAAQECARSVSDLIPCSFEYRLLLPDGTVRWVAEKGDFLFDETGQPRHLCGVMMDITSRKIAEETLRESDERFRQIAENIDEVVWICDPKTNELLYINPVYEKIWGRTCAEAYSQPTAWLDTIHQLDRERVISEFMQYRQEGGEHCYRIVRSDGSVGWIRARVFPVRDEAGQIYRIVGISEDITVRQIAEEETLKALQRERELSEAKSRFIAMTSHDLRTPLTTIQSSVDLLKHRSEKLSEERQQVHLERISSAVEQMTGMVQDVLILSEAEAGKLQFNPEPVDLVQLCRTLVSELQFANTHQHSLTFAVSGECGKEELLLDSKLVRYILINLLTNASKYSPQGSPIQFDLTCHLESVVFRIQDQGTGIPPEDIPRLFESFYRASNAGTVQGTGLGLAIAKQCVDLHGGEITVDSVVGEGTTFTVTLPLHDGKRPSV